jgi:hypothetical protein
MSSRHFLPDFVWSSATLTCDLLLLPVARASLITLKEHPNLSNGSALDQTPTPHYTPPTLMVFTVLEFKTRATKVQVLDSQTRTVMVMLRLSVPISTSHHAGTRQPA